MIPTLHILLFVTVIFFVAVICAYVLLNNVIPTVLQTRMARLFSSSPLPPTVMELTLPLSSPVKRWIEPLAGAAMNSEQWLTSPLQIRFSNAGLNGSTVAGYYFGTKIVLTLILPILGWLFLAFSAETVAWWMYVITLLTFCVLGFYLPALVLDRLVARRRHELFLAFPDALDLLRVCVEAGLGLDAAVERVGREMQLESYALAQEFSLLGLELRAGATRTMALSNLALRIGLEDIDSLVSMLIQADRFGTSIAESLQMHSEALRAKRRLTAEEAAAKLPVKILMPLIFCVFPALLTVLMGPAVITIFHLLIPRLSNP
jgi:tight adherence protein C